MTGRQYPLARVSTSSDRLQRLLALVPYVISRKVVGLSRDGGTRSASASASSSTTSNLLWCVELRAPDPYCPIDLSYEGGEIVVSQAESMDRPLRLAVDEASALLVALRMLAEVGRSRRFPSWPRDRRCHRAIAKLEAAAGEAGGAQRAGRRAGRHPATPSAERRRAAARRRSARRRVHLRYYVPGRDEATERDVDPMRLLVVEGRPYLEGWCRRAEGVRLFRLDRVLGLDVLDVRVRGAAAEAEPVDVDQRPLPAVARRLRW